MLKKRVKGGVLATIGYILSPFSWWNDLVVNLPLSYAFALPFGFVSRSLFIPAMVVGYWITNIVGFILLHKGTSDILLKSSSLKEDLPKYVIISIAYTLLILVLVYFEILKFPLDYFS